MESESRNPDAILQQIVREEQSEQRGKLKIFFGYAAGVGKTYAMLSFAHTLKEKGVDVVAGYIEPHARPETAALMKGLEILPVKLLQYHNITVKEFDVDGALERNPQAILVDELAHTNVEGSRHQKRYQDIQELLKAGMDVYTTVNVQHIESLNDLVSSITHIQVRERIPDFVFDQADQVELVDIEPEDLLERLKAGKVYGEDKASQAMHHFFTLENLISLREMALRRMADGVNLKQEKRYKAGESQIAEHILICLSPSPSNEKVIRQAARMAAAFRGKFTAFFVETPEYVDYSKEDLERVKQHTKLAEQLGAKTVISYGSDIVEQIAEYSKVARVSKIVLGRTYTKRKWFSISESFSDKLSRLDPNLEVFLIPDFYDKRYRTHNKKKMPQLTELPQDILKAAIILAMATGVAYLFKWWNFSDANLIMSYILGVLLISLVTTSRICSMAASVVSVLIFNFCFTVPIMTLSVNDPSYIATFGIMFLTASIGATLTQKVKQYARQASKKAYRTEILLETSQKLQRCNSGGEIVLSTTRQLSKLLERTVIFYEGNPAECEKPVIFMKHDTANLDHYEKEALKVAQWVYVNNKHAGFSTTTLPGAPCLCLAVRNGDKVFGVIGIFMNNRALDAFEEGLMNAILNECALALEKNELLQKRKKAELQLQQEKLRADLLRSISHDLRTPLTSISGNAGILMSGNAHLPKEKRQALYEDIYDDSMWLINLVENLLSVTRIENGTMKLNLQGELLDEVIQEAVKHIHRRSKDYHIVVQQESEFIMAKMDVKLILQVLINLVDNAMKYTPSGSTIRIETRKENGRVIVEVADNGPGIEEDKKEKLFDMFYTGNHSVADGRRSMGMGLALCKSIVRAHNGEIKVLDNQPCGTIFQFSLQEEEVKMI
ncbi:MAG: sensor histidine kinase KdpD [Lachnospiraceae bacterium]